MGIESMIRVCHASRVEDYNNPSWVSSPCRIGIFHPWCGIFNQGQLGAAGFKLGVCSMCLCLMSTSTIDRFQTIVKSSVLNKHAFYI